MLLMVSVMLMTVSACSTTSVSTTDLPVMIRHITPGIVTIANDNGAVGSGFVVDENGLIATNKHIATKANLYVILPSGQRLLATILESDKQSDVAILAVKSTNLFSLKLELQQPDVGDSVIVIGNPFGLGITASRGIISAVGRSIGKAKRLQTDAAINPGNSGGPLLNMNGSVLGIVNSRSVIGSGVGFAVPASVISDLLKRVRASD